MGDHVHIFGSNLPKYAVSQVVSYIKGKSSIHIAKTYAGYRNNVIGWNFWARGYFVLAVGRDGDTIHKYIKRQKETGKRIDPLKLFFYVAHGFITALRDSQTTLRPCRESLDVRGWFLIF